MALVQPRYRWQVRWDGINYVDITDRLLSVEVRHGAGVGNPDRPTIMSGRGRALMRGTLTDEQRQGRFHMHLFEGDDDDDSIWGGFILAPRQAPGPEPRIWWEIEGHHAERIAQPSSVTIPTQTLAGLFTNDDFWSGATGQTPIIVGGIPDRATIQTDFSGRVGTLWSAFAAIGSYEVTEDNDGRVHLTRLVPSQANIPDTTQTLDNRTTQIYRNVVTRDRADRIRNILVDRGTQIYRNTNSAIQWGARTLEVPGWWSSVSVQSEARAVIDELAELHREHTVTIPLAQQTLAKSRFVGFLNTGSYLYVTLRDPEFNIDINETCIIMERRVSWSQDKPTTITLRLLETGLQPPEPTEETFRRVLEDGSLRLLEDGFDRLLEDAATDVVESFNRLLESGDVRLLEDGSERLLEDALNG